MIRSLEIFKECVMVVLKLFLVVKRKDKVFSCLWLCYRRSKPYSSTYTDGNIQSKGLRLNLYKKRRSNDVLPMWVLLSLRLDPSSLRLDPSSVPTWQCSYCLRSRTRGSSDVLLEGLVRALLHYLSQNPGIIADE